MVQQRKLLGKILEEMKVAKPDQVKQALKKQMQDSGKKLGEILIEMGICKSAQITEALARQFDYPFVDLKNLKLNPEVTKAVPRAVCEEHTVFPIKANGKSVTLAISDPLDLFMMDNLKFILNTELECVLAPKEDILTTITKYYGSKEKANISSAIEQATMTQTEIKVRGAELDANEAEAKDDDAPVIKFCQLMIAEAVKARASDIHVEPMEDRVRIRYRVDGICQEVNSPPKRLQGAVL